MASEEQAGKLSRASRPGRRADIYAELSRLFAELAAIEEPAPKMPVQRTGRRGPRFARNVVVTDLDREIARKALVAKGMLPADEDP